MLLWESQRLWVVVDVCGLAARWVACPVCVSLLSLCLLFSALGYIMCIFVCLSFLNAVAAAVLSDRICPYSHSLPLSLSHSLPRFDTIFSSSNYSLQLPSRIHTTAPHQFFVPPCLRPSLTYQNHPLLWRSSSSFSRREVSFSSPDERLQHCMLWKTSDPGMSLAFLELDLGRVRSLQYFTVFHVADAACRLQMRLFAHRHTGPLSSAATATATNTATGPQLSWGSTECQMVGNGWMDASSGRRCAVISLPEPFVARYIRLEFRDLNRDSSEIVVYGVKAYAPESSSIWEWDALAEYARNETEPSVVPTECFFAVDELE